MCVCVCVCARARARVCVCVCVSIYVSLRDSPLSKVYSFYSTTTVFVFHGMGDQTLWFSTLGTALGCPSFARLSLLSEASLSSLFLLLLVGSWRELDCSLPYGLNIRTDEGSMYQPDRAAQVICRLRIGHCLLLSQFSGLKIPDSGERP